MRSSPLESAMRSRSRCIVPLLVLLIGVALSIYAMLGEHSAPAHLTGSIAMTRAQGGDPEPATDVEPATGRSQRLDQAQPSAATRPRPADQPVGGSGGFGNGLGEVSFQLAGELNEEERAILRAHRLAEVGQLVAAAHKHNEIAHEHERARTQHAYQTLLSLWMKVHRQDGPERSSELLRREEELYFELPAEQIRLFHLPISPEERREKLDEFKAQFYARFGD